MKKILIGILLSCLLFGSCGCSRGNERQTKTAVVYNRAIVITNEEVEIQISKYYIGSLFITLWSTDGKLYAVPHSQVMLISDEGEGK